MGAVPLANPDLDLPKGGMNLPTGTLSMKLLDEFRDAFPALADHFGGQD